MRESIRKNRAHREGEFERANRHDKHHRGHAHSGRMAEAVRKAWPRSVREVEEMLDADPSGRARPHAAGEGDRW